MQAWPQAGGRQATQLGCAENGAFKGRIPDRSDSQAKISPPLGDAGDNLRPRQCLNDNGDVRPVGAKAPDRLRHSGTKSGHGRNRQEPRPTVAQLSRQPLGVLDRREHVHDFREERLRLGRRLQWLLFALEQAETETFLRLLQHTADRWLGNIQGDGRVGLRARLHHAS